MVELAGGWLELARFTFGINLLIIFVLAQYLSFFCTESKVVFKFLPIDRLMDSDKICCKV